MRLSRKKLNKLIKEELAKILVNPEDDSQLLNQEDEFALDFIVKHALNEAKIKRNKKVRKIIKESESRRGTGNPNISEIGKHIVRHSYAKANINKICFDMDGVLVDFAAGVANIAGSIANMKNLALPDNKQDLALTSPGGFEEKQKTLASSPGILGVTGSKIFTFLVDIAGKVKHMLSGGKYKDAAYHEDFIKNNTEFNKLVATLAKNPTFRQRFWQTLPPNQEGMKLYMDMKGYFTPPMFNGRIGILTSPLLNSTLDTVEGKKRWIASFLLESQPDFVIMDGNKQKYAVDEEGMPCILIDDWNFNCESFKNAGGVSFLFRNGVVSYYGSAVMDKFNK